jgi:hypothetical protein
VNREWSQPLSRLIRLLAIVLLLGALKATPTAAHQVLQVGDYIVEYSWEQEPALAGQANALLIGVRGMPVSRSELGKLTLITPLEGMVISGDALPVAVQIKANDGNLTKLTWQIYVDDRLVASPTGEQPTVLVQDVANGAHTVKVALTGADSTPASVQITMRNDAANAGGAGAQMTIPPPVSLTYSDVDISSLAFEVVYRGQTQPLPFQPQNVNAFGQHRIHFTPDQPGVYVLQVQGVLDGNPVDAQVVLDPVRELTFMQRITAFLPVAMRQSALFWGVIGGVVLGVIALGLRARSQASV